MKRMIVSITLIALVAPLSAMTPSELIEQVRSMQTGPDRHVTHRRAEHPRVRTHTAKVQRTRPRHEKRHPTATDKKR